jgi:hypothetical protein
MGAAASMSQLQLKSLGIIPLGSEMVPTGQDKIIEEEQ